MAVQLCNLQNFVYTCIWVGRLVILIRFFKRSHHHYTQEKTQISSAWLHFTFVFLKSIPKSNVIHVNYAYQIKSRHVSKQKIRN